MGRERFVLSLGYIFCTGGERALFLFFSHWTRCRKPLLAIFGQTGRATGAATERTAVKLMS